MVEFFFASSNGPARQIFKRCETAPMCKPIHCQRKCFFGRYRVGFHVSGLLHNMYSYLTPNKVKFDSFNRLVQKCSFSSSFAAPFSLFDIGDIKRRNWERQIARNGKLSFYFKNNFNLLVMNVTQLNLGSKACKTPLKFLDDETSLSCTNLLKTLIFLRKKILSSWRWNYCIRYKSFRNTELLVLCSEGSVGMKISLFFVVVMAQWT